MDARHPIGDAIELETADPRVDEATGLLRQRPVVDGAIEFDAIEMKEAVTEPRIRRSSLERGVPQHAPLRAHRVSQVNHRREVAVEINDVALVLKAMCQLAAVEAP